MGALLVVVLALVAALLSHEPVAWERALAQEAGRVISLPDPTSPMDATTSDAVGYLTLVELSDLIWPARTVAGTSGAGPADSSSLSGTFDLYVVVGRVMGLEVGLYRYRSEGHGLVHVVGEDLRAEISSATMSAEGISEAAAVFVVAGTGVDRQSAEVRMIVGASLGGVRDRAIALGLQVTPVTAYFSGRMQRALRFEPTEGALGILSLNR